MTKKKNLFSLLKKKGLVNKKLRENEEIVFYFLLYNILNIIHYKSIIYMILYCCSLFINCY